MHYQKLRRDLSTTLFTSVANAGTWWERGDKATG